MLDKRQQQSLLVISKVAREAYQRDEFSSDDLQNLLICLPSLLEKKNLVKIFLRWLGKMAVLPQVLQEAGIWAWALKKFSQVTEKW